MTAEATALSPREQQTAQQRLHELAESFTAAGTLRTPVWRQVFTRTWRHPYVPAYYPELRSAELVSAAEQGRRERWLSAVYSDQTLITRVIRVPAQNGVPGTYRYASSSSLPSLVLRMLEALELTDGQRVLEIGTGSGYNAALLCERLGSTSVTSVDIDPQLVDLARERLGANGYTPTLAAVDGYPPGAPYDRIIATCSVPAIPPAWPAQVTPGGMIMADVRGLLGGTVARLTVDDDGIATGRFLPHYGEFMPLRPDADTFAPMQPRRTVGADAVDSVSPLDPTLLQRDVHVRFVAQWPLAGLVWRFAYADDGDVATQLETPTAPSPGSGTHHKTVATSSPKPVPAGSGTASSTPLRCGTTKAGPTTTASASHSARGRRVARQRRGVSLRWLSCRDVMAAPWSVRRGSARVARRPAPRRRAVGARCPGCAARPGRAATTGR